MPLSPMTFLAPVAKAAPRAVDVYVRRRNRLIATKLAARQRGYLHDRLTAKLTEDGFHLNGRPGLSQRDIAALLNTFRVKDLEDTGHLRGAAVLDRLHDRISMTYLMDAPSGEGKTTFALALALHRSRLNRRLAPLYLDVADESYGARLQRWMLALDDGRDAAGKRLDVSPLIMLDGVNETHTVEAVVTAIAPCVASLRHHHVRLLFLFSHRHRSYTGELVKGLTSIGIATPRQLKLELLSDAVGRQRRVELGFYPPQVQRALDRYASAHPEWTMTRADGAALMRWMGDHPGTAVDDAPSPAELVAEQFITAPLRDQPLALQDLASAAFDMLGREVTTRHFVPLDRRLDGAAKARLQTAKRDIDNTPLGERVRILDDAIQIDSEQAIRVLGAMHVARRLQTGDPPTRLSGRTAYDSAAPFVPWALRWLTPNASIGDLVEHRISAELTRRDRPAGEVVPYSFYGRLLFAGDAPTTTMALKAEFFRSIIDDIDRDRRLTCQAAILAARRTEQMSQADPVLDQLFALVDCIGPAAVPSLLDVMNGAGSPKASEDLSLVRSQVAYLLVAWIQRLPPSLTDEERFCISLIGNRMHAGDPNLHLRYHQAQVVEGLMEHADAGDRSCVRNAAAAVAEAPTGSPPPGAPAIYQALQAAVTARMRALLQRSRPSAWPGATETMLEILDGNPLGLDRSSDQDLLLECWETTLGLSALAFRERGSQELKEFVLEALSHDLWIVRWWAYTGLTDMFKFVAERERGGEVEELGRRIVDGLLASGEPIGLKQQQCALVERLLDAPREPAIDWLRAELASRRHQVLVEGHDQFARPYVDALHQSAESYLRDFAARVHRLRVHAS